MRAVTRLAAAAIIAFVAMAAVPAWAADSTSLDVQTVNGRTVKMVMTFNRPESSSASPAVSGTVDIDGTTLPAETSLVSNQAPAEMAVLVLDTSGSMKGARLAAAKSAATNFVNDLPAGVNVGLVSFNQTPTVHSSPTKDRAKVLAGIDGLQAGGTTALYDGVEKALGEVPPGTPARVLVLSDGKDTASKATLDELKKSATDRGVPIDVIALRPTTAELETLREVSGSSTGQLRTVSTSGDLLGAFASASQAFNSQALLTVEVPPTLNASGKGATASLDVDGTVLTGTTTIPVTRSLRATVGTVQPATDTSTVTSSTSVAPPDPPRQFVPLIMGLIVAGTALLIGYIVLRVRQQNAARRRIDQVLLYRPTAYGSSGAPGSPQPQKTLVEDLDDWLATRDSYRVTRNGLAAAGLDLTPGAWLLIRLSIMAVLALVLSLFLGSILLGILLGLVLGWLLTRIWLRSRASKRRKMFGDELPDFLNLLASGLRAGLSFNSALESGAAEGKGEVGRQMRRALTEVQVGAQLDKALMECADRMENDDLRWTVTALSIQREVGGNLSTILESAAATIKARHELGREVQTLTAEGRLSAYVLISLPLGVFAFLALFRREYISVLWTTTLGLVMLASIFILIILGWFWMRAVIRIKV